ncbi:MAG: biotin transporter BioY [Vicinamibacterales bacterium]
MHKSRASYLTYDSTLLDHMSVAAASSAARVSMRVASVLFVTALTAAAAQVSLHLPFTPVPFTFQPMIVLLGGAALGARLGASAQVLYLLLGIAGAPVFAASGVLPPGAARLLGPTGGYLMAYPLAAFVTGWLAGRGFDRRYLSSIGAMLAGMLTYFAGGVAWLAITAGAAGVPMAARLDTALAAGFYPFVLADAVKVAFASAVLPAVWALVSDRPKTRKY